MSKDVTKNAGKTAAGIVNSTTGGGSAGASAVEATAVEATAIKRSGLPALVAPAEKIPVVMVDNFPSLGYVVALRFLEWVIANPGGVISLPTGKTPEHFIKEVKRILGTWESDATQQELKAWGLDTTKKPDMAGLHFVQIDEFYPMNPKHNNSFHYYVNRYYIEGFGLDPGKALLINNDEIGIPEGADIDSIWGSQGVDLGLRYRHPLNSVERRQQLVLRAVDQWCTEYERRIRALGGIGFFLGGIGPDGHIGFNVRGSDAFSTTRLTDVNYETQAAAATDLGGIEVSRRHLVITIGLSTITYNPNCVAIIMAAGEAKATIVANSIESAADNIYPATALEQLKNARFFLTHGAAKQLHARQLVILDTKSAVTDAETRQIVINISLSKLKPIRDLTLDDYRSDPFGALILKKTAKTVGMLNESTYQSLVDKIEAGIKIRTNRRFLHTEPHHDDIMLGYLPFAVRHIREHSNHHHFVTLTSGFTAVTNAFMLEICRTVKDAIDQDRFGIRARAATGYFANDEHHARDRDTWRFLDGLAAESPDMMDEGLVRRFVRNLIAVFDDEDIDNIGHRVDELIHYFETQYPGKKDLPYIQQLKGMVREWESACLWGYFGWDSSAVDHLRLGFYTGSIFTEEPTVNRDVLPVLELMKRVMPDVVTVAFDPEASGPDTHYKVLQAIAEALKLYEEQTGRTDIEVIGYRNIWYRFHPAEADLFVPVSLNMLALQHSSFMNTYVSQKHASFPSYEYDGPFSLLAQKIQVEQYEMIRTCLGPAFFYEHPSALIRATKGFVYIKSMQPTEFYEFSRDLKKQAENR